MEIYLLNYNNYYNRIVKKEETLEDYQEFLCDNVKTGINFIPGDYVKTSLIVKTNSSPDYLIAASGDKIDSRWFIVEQKRTTGGQHLLTLYRDTIVDYYDTIIDAPTFIEKATLSDTDVGIFNSENMTFNQIKTSQTELKDKSGVAWLVGYLSPKFPLNEDNEESNLNFSFNIKENADIYVEDLSQWEYNKYANGSVAYSNYISGSLQVKIQTDIPAAYEYLTYSFSLTGNQRPVSLGYNTSQTGIELEADSTENLINIINNNIVNNSDSVKNTINLANNNLDFEYLKFLSGKVIYNNADNSYYKAYVEIKTETINRDIEIGSNINFNILNDVLGPYTISGDIRYYIDGQIRRRLPGLTTIPSFSTITVNQVAYFRLTKLEGKKLSFTIDKDTNIPIDAPYRIICMPYDPEKNFVFYKDRIPYESNSQVCMAAMQEIIRTSTGTNSILYDAQILPYCPVLNNYYDNVLNQFRLDLDSRNTAFENVDYSYIKETDGNVIKGIIFYCDTSTFSVNIDLNIPVDNVKLSNECDKYRLASPNYNGAFDFNLAQNGGLNGLIAECTYKPYNPYINVSPVFGGLYGNNFKDPRGLICGGDFSLPVLTDQWEVYERNNKNYQLAFDRQIQNMEVKQGAERFYQITDAITGVAEGAMAGGQAGGVQGAIIGAVVGTVTGVADVAIGETLRNEAIDYTKDQFGYSLGNIKALPYSLSKVGAYNADNTIYPVLEYYTCSDIEKQALLDKIKYNGMTVMRIGKIKDFLWDDFTYIKGKIIRIEGVIEDYHITKVIASEINKGVFIK